MTHRYRIEIAAITVLLLALSLLMGFESVVRQSVHQAETRRLAVLRQAEAWSDCGRQAPASARATCRAGLAQGDARVGAVGRP